MQPLENLARFPVSQVIHHVHLLKNRFTFLVLVEKWPGSFAGPPVSRGNSQNRLIEKWLYWVAASPVGEATDPGV